MDKNNNLTNIYKELSTQAIKNGYYLIPQSFYDKLINALDYQKTQNKTISESRNKWKKKYYDLKRSINKR